MCLGVSGDARRHGRQLHEAASDGVGPPSSDAVLSVVGSRVESIPALGAYGVDAGAKQSCSESVQRKRRPQMLRSSTKDQRHIAASAPRSPVTAQRDMAAPLPGCSRKRACPGQQQQQQPQRQHSQSATAFMWAGPERRCAEPITAGSAAMSGERFSRPHLEVNGTTGPAVQLDGYATPARRWPRRVMAGTGPVTAHTMHDCTALYRAHNWEALRTRLRLDGYVLLRNVLDAAAVTKARDFLLDQLQRWRPDAFAALHNELLAEGTAALGLLARQDLAAAAPVAAVLEAPQLFDLTRGLQSDGEGEMVTSGYKWLRAVAKREFTGLHCDRVFLGRGSLALLTAWLPLGDVPTERGSLLVARGSHRLRAFDALRGGYGASEVGADGTRSGWLADDGRRLRAMAGSAAIDWRTADCAPGDVIVLGLDVLHMSASNTTDLVRLSCDTRWQPACEPRDPRLAMWRDRHGEAA